MGQYLIRVEGKLSDELVSTFPTLDSSQRPQTVLHGAVDDGSSLADILERLRGVGVNVIDVHLVPRPGETALDPPLAITERGGQS